MNCADKFLKHSERVGARFAELNAGAYPPCSYNITPLIHVAIFSFSEAMGGASGSGGAPF
jgi:hypothetical protein